jgi:hypothetical protein
MKLSATAQAVTQALLIHTMQKPEELQSKRDLFEDITHAHYLERWKDQPYEPMSKEAFCKRNPDLPDFYFYSDLNTSWWGFQAGFMAAALSGAKAES